MATQTKAEIQAELTKTKQALSDANARIEGLCEELESWRNVPPKKEAAPQGEAFQFDRTLVLADTQALSHWSGNQSARWGVDFEGASKEKVEWLANQMQTPREKLVPLADGNFRLVCANRNAAMKIETSSRLRLEHERENSDSPIDCTVNAVALRSLAITARDASRATGIGRFSLGSHHSLSFLGPTKVYLQPNGDVVIRQQ